MTGILGAIVSTDVAIFSAALTIGQGSGDPNDYGFHTISESYGSLSRTDYVDGDGDTLTVTRIYWDDTPGWIRISITDGVADNSNPQDDDLSWRKMILNGNVFFRADHDAITLDALNSQNTIWSFVSTNIIGTSGVVPVSLYL